MCFGRGSQVALGSTDVAAWLALATLLATLGFRRAQRRSEVHGG